MDSYACLFDALTFFHFLNLAPNPQRSLCSQSFENTKHNCQMKDKKKSSSVEKINSYCSLSFHNKSKNSLLNIFSVTRGRKTPKIIVSIIELKDSSRSCSSDPPNKDAYAPIWTWIINGHIYSVRVVFVCLINKTSGIYIRLLLILGVRPVALVQAFHSHSNWKIGRINQTNEKAIKGPLRVLISPDVRRVLNLLLLVNGLRSFRV